MKKVTLLITALSLVLGLSQCRKPNAPAINGGNGTQHVVLEASFDNGGSKIAEDGNGGLKWATGDEITVRKGGVALNPGTLRCDDAENGIFTGDIASTSGMITFTYGEQNFASQTGLLNGAVSLSSGDVAYNPEGTYNNVLMTMPHAVLKLDLSALGTAEGTKVTISAGGSEVASVTGVKETSTEVYVAMLAAASREYTFSGNGKTGKVTWALAANTFYTKSGSSTGEAIVVAPTILYIPGDFTVNKLAGKKVKFAKGNLYWDGSSWKLEANQWDYRTWAGKNSCIGGTVTTNGTPSDNCGLFKWGNATEAIAGNSDTPSGVFFAASDFTVEGEKWFTLSNDEWRNLLGINGASSARDNASSLRGWRSVAGVNGLVILPDGSTTSPGSIITAEDLAAAGAVFLPAVGFRGGTNVYLVGSAGNYWSSTPDEGIGSNAYGISFGSNYLSTNSGTREGGICVRLVR